MTEREAPARLEDQPDTLAMIETAFGGARDILMNGTTMRYLSDHIEELIAARVAVAWQASRKQMAEEAEKEHAAERLELHLLRQRFESQQRLTNSVLGDLSAIRSLTPTGEKA